MSNLHEMHLSEIDFGDNRNLIVCHQCSRSMSVEGDEDGALMWHTLEIIDQGDFFALHRFSTSDDPNLSTSVGMTN